MGFQSSMATTHSPPCRRAPDHPTVSALKTLRISSTAGTRFVAQRAGTDPPKRSAPATSLVVHRRASPVDRLLVRDHPLGSTNRLPALPCPDQFRLPARYQQRQPRVVR